MAKRTRSKVKSDDFLNWDDSDIDLGDILGEEYTDMEMEMEMDEWIMDADIEKVSEKSQDSDEWDQQENTPPSKKKKESQINGKKRPKKSWTSTEHQTHAKYRCTVCTKELRTIAGLRGHMLTQHQVKDFKAAEHRVSVGPALMVSERPLTAYQDFKEAIPGVTSAALYAIENTSVFAKSKAPQSRKMVEMAKGVDRETLPVTLCQEFHALCSHLDKGVTLACGRESMWDAMHKLRTNDSFVTRVAEACNVNLSENTSGRVFVQFVLTGVLDELLKKINLLCTKESMPSIDLDTVDQEVIYYISGYILRRVKQSDLAGTDILLKNAQVTDSTQSSFKDKYSGWTADVSRGGLISASDNMFLLLRSIENIVLKNVNISNLHKTALLQNSLHEAIMEDFLVNHYWDILTKDMCTKDACFLLEFVVSLYQRVRGHAVAKLARRNIEKTRGAKKQKALRKALKDSSNTNCK